MLGSWRRWIGNALHRDRPVPFDGSLSMFCNGMAESQWWIDELNRLELEQAGLAAQVQDCRKRRTELFIWLTHRPNYEASQLSTPEAGWLYGELDALDEEMRGLASSIASATLARHSLVVFLNATE